MTVPITVLHTVPHLERGGTQRWLLDLFSGFERAQLPITNHALILGERDEMLTEFEKAPCELHRVSFSTSGPLAKTTSLRTLVKLVRDRRVDVIQSHSRFDRPYAYAAGRLTGTPVVDTLHSEFSARRPTFTLRGRPSLSRDNLEALLARWALSAIVTSAPHLLALWKADVPPPTHRLALPPFVGSQYFSLPTLPAGDPLRLITVARLVSGKRVDLVIEALSRLLDTRDVELTVVGDGPERTSLEQTAADLGVSGSVHFLGSRDDVAVILADHHVFVLPTESEGQATAILEAAAAGLAVCATDLPSLRNLALELSTFVTIADVSARGLAEAIEEAARSLTELDDRARDRRWLRDHLQPENAARLLHALYGELSGGPSR